MAKRKVKMAMAIRGSTNYYQLRKIQYRHFIQQGKEVGFTEAEVMDLINSVIRVLDTVIENVSTNIPEGFPTDISDKIFAGMKTQANKLNVHT